MNFKFSSIGKVIGKVKIVFSHSILVFVTYIKKYFFMTLNPISAIVQLTEHLGFEPGVREAAPHSVFHVDNAAI